MTKGIKDKVVVVTGASSGLGEASARLLSDQGATVVLGPRARGPAPIAGQGPRSTRRQGSRIGNRRDPARTS